MSRLGTVLPVAFSGAPGAYSEEAALRHFGPGAPTLTCGTAREAVAAVADLRASHAVLAVENSITGPFEGVAEILHSNPVHAVGEVLLPIRHCLLAAPGARLDEIAVVTSHLSALSQCRDFLASWGVATRPARDTAEAARDLERSGDAALGVIGSRALAELYGLSVLAEGVADRPDNRNRFLVFAAAPRRSEGQRRSAAVVGPVLAPRALKTLRIQLEAHGATRVRAPFLGSSDGTLHLIEFDHRAGFGPELAERACARLAFRYLGSWDPEA
jgi:prephenate dehydratase